MNDCCRNGGATAAIAVIDILDDFLSALMFEINIDIGRFLALPGNEAGEKQVMLHRINRGNAKQVTNHAIGGAAAALAEDIFGPRIVDNVMDRQKIGRIFKLVDKLQFFVQLVRQFAWDTARVRLCRRFPGKMFQPSLRCPSFRNRLVRIMIAQLVERKMDAGQKALGFLYRLRAISK